MQTDLRVLRVGAEEIQVDLEPAPKDAALRHLTMYSIGRDVAVADATAERALLSLIGPRAAEIAASPPLPEFANETATRRRDRGAGGRHPRRDRPLRRRRRPRPPARRPDRGRARSRSPPRRSRSSASRPGSPASAPRWTRRTMPAEAAIVEDAVSFTKGCYIGQETVARLHYKGKPNRHLRGLQLSGAADPRRRPAARREGGRDARRRRRLPRPRADRTGDRPPRGGARHRARRR